MSRVAVLFLTVPLITAFVGWVTNWAAVRMIFGPQQFMGIGPIGWQGVLPRRAEKFAGDMASTMTDNVMTTQELFEQLDPDGLDALFREALDEQIPHLTQEVVEAVRPGLWDDLFEPVRAALVDELTGEAERMSRQLSDRLDSGVADLIDLKGLVVEMLSGDNTHRLVRITRDVARSEFRFIVWYGGVFGLMIGVAQAVVFSVFERWWLMPVVGMVVGLVTNWLAIQMIFRPLEPRRFLAITWQGLFPKRQAQIAADYGRVGGEEILTPHNLVQYLTTGERGDRLVVELVGAVERLLAENWAAVEPLLPVDTTPELLARVRDVILERLVVAFEQIEPELEGFLDDQLEIAEMVEDRLASMPPERFERVLRGVFEEDEITLILIGGALGALVGLIQGAIVLAANI